MYSILLVVIYLAFISLGLPDSLLGSAWPSMQADLGIPVSYAGIISMIISAGTIVSSLMSDKLTKKLGAGLVTAVSVVMTAAALFGFSVSSRFVQLCLWAIPYGLGAGAVDAALNNYVALHYSSRHMSWLHCFWGIGTSISPYIMSYSLLGGRGWQNGYQIIFIIQIIISAILFVSLPLWKKRTEESSDSAEETHSLKNSSMNGVIFALITFFAYCAVEATAGLWASSYLVEFKGIDTQIAARFASLFYIGITIGRFMCGFIADKIGDKLMIRLGILVAFSGAVLILLPLDIDALALGGLVIIGFGCAPVYPAMIHSTPKNFGEDNSQKVIGIQMASAYTGTTLMPPLFGIVAQHISISLYPLYLLIFIILMITMSEKLNKLKNA